MKMISRNKRALRDYSIEERFEAGVMLVGSEVKSLRQGKCSLTDAFVEEVEGELFLVGANIPHYVYANILNHDPARTRKLLLNAREIERIHKRVRERGYTAVALSIYFNDDNRVKVEIALAKGKRQYDKRHDIRTREENRAMSRIIKQRNEG